MNYQQQMNQWSSKHQPKWLVVLRIFLGMFLIVKGIQFVKDATLLENIMRQSVPKSFWWLGTAIPWLHLLGGTFIVAGLFTRLSAVLQIPVLIGAVFFVNAKQGMLTSGSDLLFSIIILLLLVFFVVSGGGAYSLDRARLRDNM
jgi:putative oxidoreductase